MSTTKEHSKVINGITYTTKTLPASTGLVIVPRILALMGEKVAALMFAASDAEGLLEDPKIRGAIFANLAKNAAETDGLLVLRDLLETTKCDKVKIGDVEVEGSVRDHFDDHFQGRYMHLIEVALWVAQVNFLGP